MDEKTLHLHATVVPIVTTERKRREREGEKKYKTKTQEPRLSAYDLMSRWNLKKHQDSYGNAMKPFGLERDIVGSTAKHKLNDSYYKEQMAMYEEDIAKLQAEVEKAKEGKSTILSFFSKGDLAKVKKEIKSKYDEIAGLKEKIKQLQASKERLRAKRYTDIAALKNGYQTEIANAIKRAEVSEAKSLEQANVIERQQRKINELDRKAIPQRYRLSSGATLEKLVVPNYQNPSLHIWTKVSNEQFDDVKYDVNYYTAQKHLNGLITDEEFVNEVFEPFE